MAVLASALLISSSIPTLRFYFGSDAQSQFVQVNMGTPVIETNDSVVLNVNVTNSAQTSLEGRVYVLATSHIDGSLVFANSTMTSLPSNITVPVTLDVQHLGACASYDLSVFVTTTFGSVVSSYSTVSVNIPCPFGDKTWTLGTLRTCPLGIYDCVNVTVTNNANISILGVIIGVLHNAEGQPIEVTSASVVLGAMQSVNAFPIVTVSGVYNVTLFAWNVDGIPISMSETVELNFT